MTLDIARSPQVIGLVGGMGPPSTIDYYNALLAAHAKAGAPARLLITHADLMTARPFVEAGDKIGLATYLASLINPLAAAGATFAAMAAVTPHLCIDQLVDRSALPIVDIISVAIDELKRRGARRVALLGNRYTMAAKMYGRLGGFDLIEMDATTTDEVHRIYQSIMDHGQGDAADGVFLKTLVFDLHHKHGADVVIVGGTELSLLLKEEESPVPLLDCAKAHVEAITRRALAS